MPTATRKARGRLRDCFYDVERRQFLVLFHDGHVYRLPRQTVPDDDGSDVRRVRVEGDGSAFVAHLASGKLLEVPWDFVLYQLEPAYSFFKGRVREELEEDAAHRIGRRIRGLREARGYTTYELAERSRIHRPNVTRIESGRHVPNLETLMRLANALQASVAELVTEGPQVPAYVREEAPRRRNAAKKRSARP